MTQYRTKVVFMLALVFAQTLVLSQVKPKDRYTVAIFLYDHVELLDFAGPGEVFGASAGFDVYTVSVDGEPVVAQGFVTIKPQYAIANAPAPDVIVFPGGAAIPSSKDSRVMTWIKSRAAAGTLMMSVCTGAAILGKAGVLDGLTVTTFHNFIEGLQQMLPQSTVLENTRYVDSGMVMTTAGVSAGIDGALHLLARIKGIDVAKATAFYMEYDKWEPEEGKIDFENPHIVRWRKELQNPEKKIRTGVINGAVPFEGEMKNLAFEFRDGGHDVEAAAVLEQAVKLYPNSVTSYHQLGLLYRKLGKPTPTLADTLETWINKGQLDKAIAVMERDQENFPGWKVFSEQEIDMAGRHLSADDQASAIKLFVLNVKLYPSSANAFERLAEAYEKAGKKKDAILNYRRSLQLNPDKTAVKEKLITLGEKI